MSADATPLGDSNARPPSRFMHHFDLYGIWVGLGFMVVASTIVMLGITKGYDPLFWVFVSLQLAYAVLMFTAARRHMGQLCFHCAEAFPIDPGAVAAGRSRWALWYVHFVFGLFARMGMVAERYLRSKILAYLVLGVVFMGVFWPLSQLLNEWFATVFVGLLVLLSYAKEKHNQLQLWCPWCRPGGNGDDDDDPEPEPEPDPAVGTDVVKVGS